MGGAREDDGPRGPVGGERVTSSIPESERYPVVVIGSGPTASFAAAISGLSCRTVLLSADPLGALRPTSVMIEGRRVEFTTLPIFPPHGPTDLAIKLRRLGIELADGKGDAEPQLLELSYAFDSDDSGIPDDPSAGSFLAFAQRNARAVRLSEKQFGPSRIHEPLAQVQAKVSRAYGVDSDAPRSRLGYVEGQSPYAPAQLNALETVSRIDDTPVSVDGPSRRIRTRKGICISYDRLVACIPVPAIADLLGVTRPRLSYAGARFMISAPPMAMDESTVTYDLRADSPIFRVAIPRPEVCVVQLSPATELCTEEQTVANHLRSLVDSETGPFLLDQTQEMAYPLEFIDDDERDLLDTACEEAGILRFGRFAQWLYLDLHELDWDALVS